MDENYGKKKNSVQPNSTKNPQKPSVLKNLGFWRSFAIYKLVDIGNKFSTKYVSIYRSILKLSYIDRYMISNIDRYMKFFKNHFSTDICRNFSFFDRYMKIFILLKLACLGVYSLLEFRKTSYIDQYNNSYIGLYKNVYKTLGDLAYIDLYTPYRFAA